MVTGNFFCSIAPVNTTTPRMTPAPAGTAATMTETATHRTRTYRITRDMAPPRRPLYCIAQHVRSGPCASAPASWRTRAERAAARRGGGLHLHGRAHAHAGARGAGRAHVRHRRRREVGRRGGVRPPGDDARVARLHPEVRAAHQVAAAQLVALPLQHHAPGL